jgi:hypothetical protein
MDWLRRNLLTLVVAATSLSELWRGFKWLLKWGEASEFIGHRIRDLTAMFDTWPEIPQWISLPLFIVAIVLFFYDRKRRSGIGEPNLLWLQKEISLCEAARMTYELVKDTSFGKTAKEVIRAIKGQTDVIEYFAYAIAEQIPIYGNKPPSLKKEKIEIPLGSGMATIECRNNVASLFSAYANDLDRNATNLFVTKRGLKKGGEKNRTIKAWRNWGCT